MENIDQEKVMLILNRPVCLVFDVLHDAFGYCFYDVTWNEVVGGGV